MHLHALTMCTCISMGVCCWKTSSVLARRIGDSAAPPAGPLPPSRGLASMPPKPTLPASGMCGIPPGSCGAEAQGDARHRIADHCACRFLYLQTRLGKFLYTQSSSPPSSLLGFGRITCDSGLTSGTTSRQHARSIRGAHTGAECAGGAAPAGAGGRSRSAGARAAAGAPAACPAAASPCSTLQAKSQCCSTCLTIYRRCSLRLTHRNLVQQDGTAQHVQYLMYTPLPPDCRLAEPG